VYLVVEGEIMEFVRAASVSILMGDFVSRVVVSVTSNNACWLGFRYAVGVSTTGQVGSQAGRKGKKSLVKEGKGQSKQQSN
jgi:hypothetical protein